MGKILITGGAGYIGSHTVRHLVREGAEVVVLDNLSEGHREALVDADVLFVEGGVGDRALLRSVFEEHRPSAVIHFAAHAYVGESVEDPLKYYENNVAAPLVMLGVMREFDCRNIVFSSSCATYGEPEALPITEENPQHPINPYGRSKLMFEEVLKDCEVAWGLRSVCLRYFNACGCSEDGKIGEDHEPETHLIPLVLMSLIGAVEKIRVFGTDYPTKDGTCIRDYIHVDDLASAHGLAVRYLENGGVSEAINLGTGTGTSVQEIIDVAERVSGKPVPVEHGPRRAGDPAELIADPSKAKRILGWKAERGIEAIVESAWRWFSAEHGGRYAAEEGVGEC
jgi:UDP-glucose 4-epimerase